MDYSQLLIDVQKKASVSVQSVRDLKLLKEEIEVKSDLVISYNTLRRVFGFLSQNTPSTNTLNKLSMFLGFNTYSAYLNHKELYNDWHFYQTTLRMMVSDQLTEEDILVIRNGILDSNKITTIAQLISCLIYANKATDLDRIFLNLESHKIDDSSKMKFATIISNVFYTIPKKDALHIYDSLNQHNSFRSIVPLYYVDYSKLNGIYADILKSVYTNSSLASERFFVKLMLSYWQFYSGGKMTNKVMKPGLFDSFNPVLKGRYFGYQILWTNDFNLTSEVFREIKKNDTSLFTQEIILSLIIKSDYKTLTSLYNLYYEDIFEFDRWTTKTRITIALLASAIINWNNKSLKIATANLEMIELEKIEMGYYEYLSLFYELVSMMITYANSDYDENKRAHINLKKLVKKTGFKIFLSKSSAFILSNKSSECQNRI